MKKFIFIALASLSLFAVSCGVNVTVDGADEAKDPSYKGDPKIYDGIVLSHEDKVNDWDAVAQDTQVQFVYLKATDGASVQDSKYKKSFKSARKSGLKVGSVHYFRITSTPEDQFKNFKKTVKVDAQDLVPMVCAECNFKKSSKEEFVASLKSFLDLVEDHFGVKPIICCSVGVYHKRLKEDFSDYNFWMTNPTIPSTNKYLVWQTDSYAAEIDGIEGGVDMGVFNNGCALDGLLMPKK